MSDIEETIVHLKNGSISPERKRKGRAKCSLMWTKFTIVSNKNEIASCNACGVHLSYKTSVSNLKKHLVRKHNYDTKMLSYKPSLNYQNTSTPKEGKKRRLTELGGLDGLLLNVVGEDGDDPLVEMTDEEGNPVSGHIVYSDDVETIHNYCANDVQDDGEESEAHHSGAQTKKMCVEDNDAEHPILMKFGSKSRQSQPQQSNNQKRFQINRRNQIMDLQLECLEIKKYTMQMEALMLERQLNLPRSFFTERLKCGDTNTRGTQTDMSGNNTKVFYVMENGSGPIRDSGQHLFTFQARTAEENE